MTNSEPVPETHTAPRKPRRWTIIASGLLIGALSIVVLFTSGRAFSSPIAVLVVAAIGFAAVLLQVRLKQDVRGAVSSPLWLNACGIGLALIALFGEFVKVSARVAELCALGAIVSFGISGAIVLWAMRKHRAAQQGTRVKDETQ